MAMHQPDPMCQSDPAQLDQAVKQPYVPVWSGLQGCVIQPVGLPLDFWQQEGGN